MLDDEAVRRLIGAHTHAGVVWFHRESFEKLLQLLSVATAVDVASDSAVAPADHEQRLGEAERWFSQIEDLSAISEYQIERFRTLLGYTARTPKAETRGG